MTKKRAKDSPDKSVEGVYEHKFDNRADLEAAAVNLIRSSVNFNYYWLSDGNGDIGNDKSGYYISVSSKNKLALKYSNVSEEDMFDAVCESWENDLTNRNADLHYFIREKMRELYELRNDDTLMGEFLEIKEGEE